MNWKNSTITQRYCTHKGRKELEINGDRNFKQGFPNYTIWENRRSMNIWKILVEKYYQGIIGKFWSTKDKTKKLDLHNIPV